jgi:uncharacterized membrane protein
MDERESGAGDSIMMGRIMMGQIALGVLIVLLSVGFAEKSPNTETICCIVVGIILVFTSPWYFWIKKRQVVRW